MHPHHRGGRRPALVILALLLVVALTASSVVAAPRAAQDGPLDRLQGRSTGLVRVEIYPPTGVARWIDAEDGVLTREFSDKGLAPESVAMAFLDAYGSLFGLSNAEDQLQLQGIEADTLEMHHVRFDQVQNGVPVFGAGLIVHLDGAGAVVSANGYVVPDAAKVNTAPGLSEKEAAATAVKWSGLADGSVAEAELTILNPGILTDQASGTYLTYRVRVSSESQPHLDQWVFVDAISSELRFAYAANPEGRNRNTYNMKHSTSYGSATLVRTEGSPPVTSATNCTVADINNAHDYAGDTYDFYFNRFGRDSYNNAGATLSSYVCYGSNYQNAFWDGTRMTYGDGFAAADDVVAHELSHGVTEYASGLIYSYQSGALNESYSDIFGEAVDLTNTGGTDTSGVRWDMGEDIPGIGAIRDMMDPTRFGDPDRTDSSYYYCSSGDSGGVHTNSGVPNKAFALMVDGGTFNGYTVAAIGMDKAVQVQYRTNEYKLTSSAKLYDNYLGLLQSCAELYGAGSSDCTNVQKALDAVKMYGPICGSGGGPTATPAGTTTPPPPTSTPTTPPTATATVPGGQCTTVASSDVPKAISDLQNTLSTLSAPNLGTITDVNVTIGQIVHTYDADLEIFIRHPDGSEVMLSTDNGGSGDNYVNTVFDDEAATAITSGSAPFTGSYRPEGLLSVLDGKPSSGTWTLRVYDDANLDTGTLQAWSVTLCGSGGGPTATPTNTPLPPTATNTPLPPTATNTPLPPTATNTPLPPTPTPTFTATPGPTQPLVNGDFEQGRFVGWAEYSARGYALVDNSGSTHSGSWRAWLGGANRETAEISQSYAVPASGATLLYWYSITSSDWCGYDFGYVRVNNTTLQTYNLCASNATGGYVQGSASLAAYAGQTVTLKFRATTDRSYSSSFYVDDVSVAAGAGLQALVDPHAGGEAIAQPKGTAPQGATEQR